MGVPCPVRLAAMIARLAHLRTHPSAFRHLTGSTVAAFDQLVAELVPVLERTHRTALDRPDRQRAVGGGDTFDLTAADHLLLAVVWLRQYPTDEVLGFLFGVSDSTAGRTRTRARPHLEKAGRDTIGCSTPASAGGRSCPPCSPTRLGWRLGSTRSSS